MLLNPNIEYRNLKQIQMTKIQNSKRSGHLVILNFDIVSYFVLRASSFL